jgi:hypothetical protein
VEFCSSKWLPGSQPFLVDLANKTRIRALPAD